MSWFCNWNKCALSDKWYLSDFISNVYDKHKELYIAKEKQNIEHIKFSKIDNDNVNLAKYIIVIENVKNG